jgi:hypothetical protein
MSTEDPRVQRAIDVIVKVQRIENPAAIKAFMPQLVKDARLLLAAIDGPAPDWADVREAARKAAITFRLVRHREMGWSRWIVTAPGCDMELRDSSGDWMASFSTSVGYANRVNPTPAQVLAMARLVGLGGDSDER